MLAAKLATKLVGSNSFTNSLVQEYFSLHFPFFFVGGEHWLSPPCSVARAQLLPTCTVPGKLFSVQGWRGRGTQVLQAWEQAELTALRKVFATIMMTIRMMIISWASQWLSAEEGILTAWPKSSFRLQFFSLSSHNPPIPLPIASDHNDVFQH